jgi:hypothetical protein
MKLRILPLMLALIAVPAACKSGPANPLLSSWTSTTPKDAYGAAGCPTHYIFTADTQTLTTGGKDDISQVSYTVHPNLVFVNMQLGSNGFKFTDKDHVEWSSGSCTYKRDSAPLRPQVPAEA